MSASATRVAVVIVSYNSHTVLRRSLACVLRQTRPAERVIVVENGARNAAFEASWAPRGVEFISLGYNAGFAAGNNFAFAHCAECSLVALVNPDAFLAPDWLARMYAAAEANPAAASFASRLVKDEVEGELDGTGDAYHLSGLVWRIAHGRPTFAVRQTNLEVFSACAAAALYRREAIDAVGGFDERFFCYLEDVDLGFRLRLSGGSCVLVWDAVARHIGSVTCGGQKSDFATYYGHRNIEWTYFKNVPLPILLATLPAHILVILVTFVVLSARGQSNIAFKAKFDAIRDLGSVLRQRREIQVKRKVSSFEIWRVMDKSVFNRSGDI